MRKLLVGLALGLSLLGCYNDFGQVEGSDGRRWKCRVYSFEVPRGIYVYDLKGNPVVCFGSDGKSLRFFGSNMPEEEALRLLEGCEEEYRKESGWDEYVRSY